MLSPVTTEPLYEKVKKQLLDYIEETKPGILPCEKDLIKLFKVSRNTVRRAVQDLTWSGVLKPVQGRGTIVMKHAEEKARDIGVICTDSLDITSPWISSMLQTLQKTAHSDNYHLNLFLCHDYTIDPLNNSAYSYLVNSGKLAGLILLSALKNDDINHIRKVGLPFVTVDFQYREFTHPFAAPDIITVISKIIDDYTASGYSRFGMLAKSTEVLEKTECRGQNDYIIDEWEDLLKAKNLPVIEYDFTLDIEMQFVKLYSLPPEQRPQILFTPFIPYAEIVTGMLTKFNDWKPIHVRNTINGSPFETPCIISNPAIQAQKAFSILSRIISAKQPSNPEGCKVGLEYKL